MRILVASQYFPPEIGAAQNRLGAFVDGLIERGHEVSVLCEQPNHPSGVFRPGFGRRPVAVERSDRRTVYRLWVAASPRKTTSRRLAFYGSYAAGAGLGTALLARHDVVFTSSPPLPGPLAVAAAARARRVPYVLDVRDLWPAAAGALGELSSPRILRALERAERWLYRGAAAVTTTTRPFCAHIDRVTGAPVSVHLPNGVRDDLLALPAASAPENGEFTVGYAGNLGLAQGLGIVLDAAEALRGEPVRFVLVGAGPLAGELRDEAARRGLDSIEFRPEIPVEQVGAFMQSCDAMLVPLRAHRLLRDFIPSKLYDAMAVGRPVLVAAAGEPSALAEEIGCGLPVPPEDGERLAQAIRRLRDDPALGDRLAGAGRAAAAGFARSLQVDRLEAVLSAASGRRTDPSAPPNC